VCHDRGVGRLTQLEADLHGIQAEGAGNLVEAFSEVADGHDHDLLVGREEVCDGGLQTAGP
jgi:hypothetical protein